MKVLSANQKFLIPLNMCTHKTENQYPEKLKYVCSGLLMLCLFTCILAIPSIIYVYKNSDNIDDYIIAFVQFLGSFSQILSAVMVMLHNTKVRKVFDDLQLITDKCKKFFVTIEL